MTKQIILHSDLNCFYAAVEMMLDPRLKGKKMAVCGSTVNRHGIVLAKSYEAKAMGVKTGQANWEARQACPDLIIVHPQYDQYIKYSRLVRNIYQRYANHIEPFGMDESWISLDSGGTAEREGHAAAQEIRQAVKEELGLTVSIGVSFSKIFAKLGSDLKKPDAVTVLGEANWRETIWPLPVSELLYVGYATTRKLQKMNINTIGDLAHTDLCLLHDHFGKNGYMLWAFANGTDASRVCPNTYTIPIKSVGHGTTCVIDLDNEYSVWLVLYELSQDIGQRLRENELSANGVQLTVKDKDLGWSQYQTTLCGPTQNALALAQTAFSLFRARYDWYKPVRALTVRGIQLTHTSRPEQLGLFTDNDKKEKIRKSDTAIDEIRRRFGYRAICSASLMGDVQMAKDNCESVIMPNYMYQ